MRVNIIGKSNLLAINDKIEKCESLVFSAQLVLEKFSVENAKEQVELLRKTELSVENLREHLGIVKTQLEEYVSIKQVIKTAIETRDLINTLLTDKKNAVSLEYENAEKKKNGRVMVEAQQELERINEQVSTNAGVIRELFSLFEEVTNIIVSLEWYTNYINVYSECVLDDLTDEELQARMLDLRLQLRVGDNDKELCAMIEQALSMCKSKLEQAGYVFVNPFKEWEKERMESERDKTQALLVELYNYSNTLLSEIMNSSGQEKIASLEYCDKEVQRAIILAEDKIKALDELLNRKG